jgi:hypothetical protein
LPALETQLHSFLKGTSGDLTKLVLPGLTAHITIWALAFYHPGTFFTGDTTDSDFYGFSPFSMSKIAVALSYPDNVETSNGRCDPGSNRGAARVRPS